MFESSEDERIYIVMEMMDGTLDEVLKRRGPLTEREAAKVFESLVKAVDFCHKNKVIHFDLKP